MNFHETNEINSILYTLWGLILFWLQNELIFSFSFQNVLIGCKHRPCYFFLKTQDFFLETVRWMLQIEISESCDSPTLNACTTETLTARFSHATFTKNSFLKVHLTKKSAASTFWPIEPQKWLFFTFFHHYFLW